MAASISPIPGPSEPRNNGILAETLYNHCKENFDSGHAITQNDLVKSDVIPSGDLQTLVDAVQELVNQRLFKVHTTREGATVWKVVEHDAAIKYRGLDGDQAVVYQCIESAERAGIWSKSIKIRTNLHASRVEKALKHLMSIHLIKQCKSVKFPSRVMYILYHLQPSEDVTGGAFFTDGVLDAVLVNHLTLILEMRIGGVSWQKEIIDPDGGRPSVKGKERASMTKAQAEAIRDAALSDPTENDNAKRQKLTLDNHRSRSSNSPENARSSVPRSKVRYLPYPAGYTGYQSVTELTNFVNETHAVNSVLPTSAVSQVLEVMVYDDKLIKLTRRDPTTKQEKIVYKARRTPEKAYAVHGAPERLRGNGMTEVPCGRCPVFDLCKEGGPVSPTNCEYWEAWINGLRY